MSVAITKPFPEYGFEVRVWYKEERGEFHVWNYTVADKHDRVNPNTVHEWVWSRATPKMTLDEAAVYIGDLVVEFLL
jgi:hypothetical protein